MQQPAMTLVEPAGAKCLRHQRVEPEQHPHAEDADGDEQRAAEADRADRFGPEGPDHERVDHAHGHPSELGDHDRRRQREHRTELGAEFGETGHGSIVAVSGATVATCGCGRHLRRATCGLRRHGFDRGLQ